MRADGLAHDVGLPRDCRRAWGWFLELHETREPGRRPIGYTEMLAWATLRDIRAEPWEIVGITAVDKSYLRWAERPRDERTRALLPATDDNIATLFRGLSKVMS